ncbi:MAG: Gfo/Idh/MocA family oxidoreductase [Akkermansiaceae bacterium]|jgi:predicted dehydrogenase|nr:Gfo/Idh/MocA family oxidoreductase [Akkermansiaceae bacterium]
MDPTRRDLLKTTAFGGLATTFAGLLGTTTDASAAAGPVTLASGITIRPDTVRPRARPPGQKPVHELTTKPLEKVRVAHIGLSRGMTHVNDCLNIEFVEVVAVCDMREERAKNAADRCEKVSGKRPEVYGGTEDIWEKMVARDDIDVVYISTPWAWHVPMAVAAMQQGKHAFVEVSAAVTVDECWQLVDTSERTQRHCVMLENCCYGENELFVLNMAREGVFGELTHAECAYIHDLRGMLYALGTEGDWRRDYHWKYDGNLYPTHGLGPVAQYMGIGRGDQFKFLVSVSSPEAGLHAWRDKRKPNGGKHEDEKYICGDMNTSIIKTRRGRTIMIQHDIISPRPYSRINALSGTGATFFDYPARLAVDEPRKYRLDANGSHEWLDDKDMARMRKLYTHPLWKKLAERAKGSGHGGMDFVMNWRHLDCIRQGITPDSVVYDAAAWSSILEISSLSVAMGSMPVPIPDFTRGLWEKMEPLPVAFKAPGSALALPTKIAEWSPADVKPDWFMQKWDASKAITGPGEYGFEFQYTRGAHRLEFRKVTLMCGDQVVARDEQAGHSGIGNSHNLYRFTVPAGDASKGYTLHAEIKSDGGTDSYGEISVFKD